MTARHAPRTEPTYDNLIHGSAEFADLPEGGWAILQAVAVAAPEVKSYFVRRLLRGRSGVRPSTSRPAPTANGPVPNGPGPRLTFSWGERVAKFGRAAKQHRLICAIWDEANRRPHPQRTIQEVMDEVYEDHGDKVEHDEYDDSFRDLCLRVRQRLAEAEIPLTVTHCAGLIWLEQI